MSRHNRVRRSADAQKLAGQRRRNRFLVALVTFIVVCLFVWPKAVSWYDGYQRHQILNQWILSAEQVVLKTGNDDAAKAVNFAVKHGVLARPIESKEPDGAAEDLESRPDPLAFHLIVLLPKDVELGEPWVGYLSGMVGGANYNPHFKRLIIREDAPRTNDAKGTLLLHESRHAREYGNHPQWDSNDSAVYYPDERDAHQMTFDIHRKLGGKPYEAYIEAKVAWLMRTTKDEQLEHLKEHGRDNDGLGPIFHPLSPAEYDTWNTNAWMDAMFRRIARDPRVHDTKAAQIMFMHDLFRTSGVHE